MPKKQSESKTAKLQANSSSITVQGPLVFISHDTRDADLAEAFANLLTDASGGMLKSFRSSDRKGTAGIEFGQEWYKAIMGNLSKATDVVALLTHHSIDRPWILYEAGVAKGTLNTTVLGAAIGIPFEKTNTGPFAQFQNCGDDEDSLTKLVLQLIRRIPDAAPREEAVRRQVQAFRDGLVSLLKSRGKTVEAAPKVDEATIAKMFEEVKVLVRDLPDRVQGQVQSKSNSRRRRNSKFNPMMFEMITDRFIHRKAGGSGVELLIAFSLFREDFPWIYELGLNFYRTLQKENKREVDRAFRSLQTVIELTAKDPMFFEMIGGPDDEESFMLLRKPGMMMKIQNRSDTLHSELAVIGLPDFLTDSQRSFHEGQFFDSLILALHPTHQGAEDECQVWMERRNTSPISTSQRIEQFQSYINGWKGCL